MVGPSNVRIQVSAAMSFDRVERTTASVDPTSRSSPRNKKRKSFPARARPAPARATPPRHMRILEARKLRRRARRHQAADGRGAGGRPFDRCRRKSATTRAPKPSWIRSECSCAAPLAPTARAATSLSVASVPFASATLAAAEAQKTDLVKIVQTAQRPVLGCSGWR